MCTFTVFWRRNYVAFFLQISEELDVLKADLNSTRNEFASIDGDIQDSLKAVNTTLKARVMWLLFFLRMIYTRMRS